MGKMFDRLHNLVWTYQGPEQKVLMLSPDVRDQMTNAERMYLRRIAEERGIEVKVVCTMPGDTAILMERDYYDRYITEDE